MPRVVHFEFPADDPGKAAAFYRAVFGWEIRKWEGPIEYWLVTTGPEGTAGINGGIVTKKEFVSPCTVVTMDVPSVDVSIAAIRKAGGTVMVPRHAIPGVGYQAYCADPSGNVFGLHQADPSAK